LNESHPLYGVYKFKEGFGGEMVDFVGCWDLPVSPVRAALWNRLEPVYFRLHQRLKGDVYY
jgi:lipid II:glycine glycyltransferase (peptidoglycan interpeptide bridge formation enzyme)